MVSLEEDGAYPPRVEVWFATPRGATAGFAGFGTLIESRIVALHTPTPGGGIAPADAKTLRRVPDRHPRVRCRVHLDRVTIVGGQLIASSPDYPDAASAVYLDRDVQVGAPPAALALPAFPWPGIRGGNTNHEVAEYLRDRRAEDPEAPPATPPNPGRGEGTVEPSPPPGIRPPWCMIWPACPGCGG